MHPTHFRVDLILINHQRGPITDGHTGLLVLEGRGEFCTGQSAHVALPDGQFSRMRARSGPCRPVRVADIFDRQLLLEERCQGGLLQFRTDLFDVIPKLLTEQPIANQVHLHAFPMGEASQRTAEHHAVKTGKRTLDLGFKLSDKLFHGVSSWCMVICSGHC
jgi:hypothetical protein